MSCHWLLIISVFTNSVLLYFGSAQSQETHVRVVSASSAEHRVALVIGNAAYVQGGLANPVNDARAMASRLRTLGFDVILHENLKTRDIGGVYREFRSRIAPGNVALVFYAGHGIQFKRQNYFPAVDSVINSEEDVPLQSLNLSSLLDNMEEAKAGVSLVFLDACRNNPYSRGFRSPSNGLAKVEAASGVLIHYATKPGSVAADGDGKNGTYTEALLAQMSEPGIPVELMLKRVANRVVAKTKGKQEPWVEGSLRGDFYFFGPTTVQVVPTAPFVPEMTAAQQEERFWDDAKAAGNKEAFDAYLDRYPKGRYANLAKANMSRLNVASLAPAGPTPTAAKPQLTTSANQAHGTVFKDCAECPEMVIIPTGTFTMGSNSGSLDEKPAHGVSIKSFALGRTEVTQGQWKAVMGFNPSRFNTCGDDCPVENVSWYDIKEFIQKINTATGKTYRLPSEAQWEYAVRAERNGQWGFGSDESQLAKYAWYTVNSGNKTHPVAGRLPNAFGIFDMHGNVLEWVEDVYHVNFNGAPIDGSAWSGSGEQNYRVLRGGSWDDISSKLHTTYRGKDSPDSNGYRRYGDGLSGFRISRALVIP
jgi:formylglycine-generating enzyme required for sulfatase activity